TSRGARRGSGCCRSPGPRPGRAGLRRPRKPKRCADGRRVARPVRPTPLDPGRAFWPANGLPTSPLTLQLWRFCRTRKERRRRLAVCHGFPVLLLGKPRGVKNAIGRKIGMKRTLFVAASPLAVGLALLGAPGLAAAQAPSDTGTTVDEIVVTAQMREQSLQDVPIVVTSVNSQQLQDAGVRDIKDLTIVAPGLTVTSTSSSAITTARIRGIGTVGDNPGLESSVGVVIDGVYRPRNGVA